jgi:Tfp pilus assembly protein PilE
LEIIIAILIVSIITTFALTKFTQITNKTHIVTLKSQLALIQNGVGKQKSQNILLGKTEDISSLDEANINQKGEELFSKVVDFSIISTDTSEKKLGSFAKTSSNSYTFYLDSDDVKFSLKDNSFVCTSQESICMQIN